MVGYFAVCIKPAYVKAIVLIGNTTFLHMELINLNFSQLQFIVLLSYHKIL